MAREKFVLLILLDQNVDYHVFKGVQEHFKGLHLGILKVIVKDDWVVSSTLELPHIILQIPRLSTLGWPSNKANGISIDIWGIYVLKGVHVFYEQLIKPGVPKYWPFEV